MNAAKCICIALLLAAVPEIMSARYVVRGRITDKNSEPLAGAGIVVRGLSGVGAMTDARGEYSLEIPDNEPHTVVVSFMGFMTQSRLVRPESGRNAGRKDVCPELTENFALEENPMTIDQVVVTGTRTPKTLMEVPIVTRVISGPDISRSDATNIQDLLITELPGIEFSYSMDQQVNVNLQGFGGSSVLFLIDGERIAGETLDNIDYNRLNLDNIERIEIVKGGASSLYGSNAVGGVLWFGLDDANMIAYVPVYCCTNRIPACFAAGKEADSVTFSWDNSFWVCNWVSNMIYPRYGLMIGDLRAVQSRLEKGFFDAQKGVEEKAVSLYEQDPAQAVKYLTDYTVASAENMHKEWRKLGEFLIVKYNDMVVKKVSGGQFERTEDGIGAAPERPGYPEDYNRRVIQETGMRYKVPE